MKIRVTIIIAILFILSAKINSAQPGTLDPSFGIGGQVNLQPAFGVDRAKDIAITTEGKILELTIYDTEAHLSRFNSDGTIDSSFGTNGSQQILEDVYDLGKAIAVDSLNRIIVLSENTEGYGLGMFLHRYLEDGTIDILFGDNGVNQSNVYYAERGLLIQSDGKIVVAGQNDNFKARISRYNDDGSKDLTFNATGSKTFNNLENSMVFAIHVQQDGKILIAGSTEGNMFVARLDQNGYNDDDFGSDGYAVIDYGKLEAGRGVQETVDEKIIVSGYSDDFESDRMLCWRFQTDGSLDSAFGDNGMVNLFTGAGNNLGAIAFANDDSTIIVGGSESDGVAYKNVLHQILNDGTINYNFGNNGAGGTEFVCGYTNELNAVKTSDGGIFLSGAANLKGDIYTAVSKILPNGHPDSSFGNAGTAIIMAIDPTLQYFYSNVYDFVILPSQKILCFGSTTASRGTTLFRLNPDGSLDSTYYETGWFQPYPYGWQETTIRVVHDSSMIYLISDIDYYLFTDEPYLEWSEEVVVLKLKLDGTPDSTFGNSGIVHFPHLPDSIFLRVKGAALQSDGKFLMAETYWDSIGFNVRVTRMNSDGTPDETFATDGVKTFDWEATSNHPEVATRSDGKIVVQTTYYTDGQYFLTSALLNPDGSFDAAYGTNGQITHPIDNYGWGDILVQDDDKTVTILSGDYPSYENNLIRLDQNGSIDFSFDGDGILPIPESSYSAASAQIDEEGKIIVTHNTWPENLWVSRYLNDGTVDAPFGTDGSTLILNVDPVGNLTYEQDYKIHFQEDGKILIAGADFPGMTVCRLLNDFATGVPLNNFSSSFRVYPNPASDQLIVSYPFSSNEQTNITITDVTGKILREEQVNSNGDHHVMKVNDFAAGIYFMTLRTEKNSASLKFVKH